MDSRASPPHERCIAEPDTVSVPKASGLVLKSTSIIQDFLSSASLSDRAAEQYVGAEVVPYKFVRDTWAGTPSTSRPRLRHLLAGSTFVFKSPEPRKKSDELKARLEQLQDIADRKSYNDIVKDVTPNEREPYKFSSYKDQLGLGLHVIVTMFTGYLVGYALFRSQFGGSPVLHAAGGMLGMVIGMLVETLLFIIRSSKLDNEGSKSTKSLSSLQHSHLKED